MLKIVSQLIQDNKEDAEMWFRFFKEGIDYMTEESFHSNNMGNMPDTLPVIPKIMPDPANVQ